MASAGPVALVTGGAVRVGRAISSALAEDGYRLIIHYNSSSGPADELVDEVRAKGGEAVAIGVDLADAEAVRRLASEAVAAFGGVDLLVNNASVFPAERLEETDEALWDHTMAVNLKAPFFLIRHLAATLRERRGVVINMADLAGIQTWAAYAAHGISKAGVIHLTRVAARSLAPEVRVNGIAPGTVLPPESMSDEEIRLLAERAPLKKNGSPDDVVRALRYLLQADFVTGETLVVDGGRLLRG
ncbi:MAG TPA: SDR family oxidoreductase [Longimicrobium sp.]|nr:SDR family oxidoreductase [Longimicrobium sp.]